MKLLLASAYRGITGSQDDSGQTSLHYTAKKSFIAEMELLVDHGASVDILDKYGLSPYFWVVIAGHFHAAQLLRIPPP